MQVRRPQMIPVASLRNFATTLKKPLPAAELASLRRHIEQFGFSAVLNVARDPDDTYVILDGNTRVEILQGASVPEVGCIVHDEMAFDVAGAADRRIDFVAGFDAHRKNYDRRALVEVAARRVEAGASIETLASVSPVKNLQEAITAARRHAQEVVAEPAVTPGPVPALTDTLILSGTPEVIGGIRSYLASLRSSLSSSEKVRDTLATAAAHLDIEDEKFLAALLAAVGTYLGSP